MLIPADYGQVNWVFAGSGVPLGAEVTMGFQKDSFVGTADEAAEQLAGAYIGSLLTVMTDGATLVNTKVKFGPNDIGAIGEFPSDEQGGLSVSQTAPQVAILINKITTFGGRSGRGRMFVPSATETDILPSGALDGPYRAAWQAEADQLLASMATADLPAMLLHSEDSPAPNPYIVQSLVVASTCATQRRRVRR